MVSEFHRVASLLFGLPITTYRVMRDSPTAIGCSYLAIQQRSFLQALDSEVRGALVSCGAGGLRNLRLHFALWC
jgi:hypothetical protein